MEKTRKAKLISIDGLDGSGKNTQSELLRDRLRAEGCTAEVVSFPMYGSPSCFAVEMYLSGALGGHPDDTGAYPAATFFAVDRYISMRTTWGKLLDTCDYIIFNRYTSANAVHQLSKLGRAEWDEFLHWLYDFEFARLGLPRPDLTLYLVVEPDVSMSLVDKRGEKKDIHETDAAYMRACYDAGLYAAAKLGFDRIDCCRDGRILPRETIADAIYGEVKRL